MGEKSSPEPGAAAGEGEAAKMGGFLAPRSSLQAQRNAETRRAARPLFSRRGGGNERGSAGLSALAGSAGGGRGGIISDMDGTRPGQPR